MALLHIERAAAGLGGWEVAHTWLVAAADGDISAGPNATLFFGAPALAFVVYAAADRPGRYERALESLDSRVAAITRRRLDQAHARIDRGDRPKLAEFDLINGLTGLGAHLLRRDPNGDLIRQVLAYLVGSPNPSVLRIFPAGGPTAPPPAVGPPTFPADTETSAWHTASAAPWRCCPSR